MSEAGTVLHVEARADENGQEWEGTSFDGEATVRISNPDAENGYWENHGPLDWFNSARITTDLEDDAVYLSVSVGDPRGAFSFAVRRLPDGRMVIHMPHPGESLAHMPTAQLHEGTLVVVTEGGPNDGEPHDFTSEPAEVEA